MITAKNYAAQAQRGLLNFVARLKEAGRPEDAIILSEGIGEIGRAVHFALPDDGSVLDDRLRGIEGRAIRLPFKSITVEYFAECESNGGDETLRVSKKRLILAREVSGHCAEVLGGKFTAETAILVTAFYTTAAGEWIPCMCGWLMPSNWDEFSLVTEEITKPLVPNRDDKKMVGLVYPFQPMTMMAATDQLGREMMMQYAMHDIGGEVRAVLELCEALSCSNVSHEPIEQVKLAVNIRRVRDGKLPLYETRCLVINAGKSVAIGSGAGGSHASPRQHLRRGHVRRLPACNIWVNSCVVGNAEKGVLYKDYAVKAA